MNQRLMCFKNGVVIGDEMWCVPKTLNWLFKINLKTWYVEGICDLGFHGKTYIDYICHYNNYICCVTAVGLRVVMYDMLTSYIEHYELRSGTLQRNRGAILHNGKLWVIPVELSDRMVSFDIKKKTFEVHSFWEKECRRQNLNGSTAFFCQTDDEIHIALQDECKVVQVSLNDGRLGVISLPGSFGLHCILKADNDFYITSFKERMLFRWNKQREGVERFYCTYRQSKRYLRSILIRNEIFLIDGETVDIFDIKSGEIRPYDKMPQELKNNQKDGHLPPLFFEKMTCGAKCFLTPWGANMLLEFNEKNRKWIGHTIKIPQDLFLRECMNGYYLLHERSISMEDFFCQIEHGGISQNSDKPRNQMGREIYRKLIEMS